MARIEMAGHRFGHLIVTEFYGNKKDGTSLWSCLCDCGQFRVIPGTKLRAGLHKSCGCLSPKFTSDKLTTHGMSRTRTYRIWAGMLERVKPNNRKKHLYYEKGITVCNRWKIFENFYADMGECPDDFTIERVDGKVGYKPSNCKWASRKDQANNTTKNHFLSFNGEALTVSQWAEKIGIKENTLRYRIRRGWTIEKALNK